MENYRQSLGKFVGGQAAGVRDQGSGGREKGPRLKLGALLGGFQEPEVSRSLRRPPCGGSFKLKLGTVPTGLRLDHGGDSYPTPRRGANKHCAYGAGYGVCPPAEQGSGIRGQEGRGLRFVVSHPSVNGESPIPGPRKRGGTLILWMKNVIGTGATGQNGGQRLRSGRWRVEVRAFPLIAKSCDELGHSPCYRDERATCRSFSKMVRDQKKTAG
jgi:hypothetical protein